jgi:hypothetical protein
MEKRGTADAVPRRFKFAISTLAVSAAARAGRGDEAAWEEARVDVEAPEDRVGAVGQGVSEDLAAGKATTKGIYNIEGSCVSKQ